MLRLTMASSVGNDAQLLIILDNVQNISLTTFNKYARVQTPYSESVQQSARHIAEPPAYIICSQHL